MNALAPAASVVAERVACATGCRHHGSHLPKPGRAEGARTDVCTIVCGPQCRRGCRGHCSGCRPRTARPGIVVCGRCQSGVRRAISELPRLVVWIGTLDVPGAPAGGPKVDGSRVPPAPARVDALDAADELHALLVSWCHLVAVKYPAPLAGPDLAGTSVRRIRGSLDQAVTGLGHGPGAEVATVRAAKWLLRWLDWALAQDFAADLVRELTAAVGTARHRWPTFEDPLPLPAPCPVCERESLVRIPPAWRGAPVTITCDRLECGELIPEATYQWHARLIADERREAVQGLARADR